MRRDDLSDWSSGVRWTFSDCNEKCTHPYLTCVSNKILRIPRFTWQMIIGTQICTEHLSRPGEFLNFLKINYIMLSSLQHHESLPPFFRQSKERLSHLPKINRVGKLKRYGLNSVACVWDQVFLWQLTGPSSPTNEQYRYDHISPLHPPLKKNTKS